MRNNYIHIIVCLAIISLSSCCALPDETFNGIPDLGISYQSLNQELHLTAPPGWNNFKTSESIQIRIQTVSENSILFKPNYGVRIFTLYGDKWTELPNMTTYLNLDNIIVPPRSDNMTSGLVSVQPDLEDNARPIHLRIFVFGYICKGGIETANVVGAYIDIYLVP